MTIAQLLDTLPLRPLTVPDSDREITGVYAGDLLSWVMGRAGEGNLWLTIMTNINVVAVASLVNTSAVIFCEGCVPEDAVIETAKAKGVTLLTAEERIFELCCRLGEIL